MEEIIDLIATDSAPSDISDKVKEILYAKASDRIEASRPTIANSIFGEVTREEDQE